MENSINETVTNQTLRSPPRRRRSTFFERRESVVFQPVSDDLDVNESYKQIDVFHQEELTRYYEKLLKEKDDWKREVNNRRNQYHDLRQQYQTAAKTSSSSRMTYSALTNEDIEFLKGKPNIAKLLESQAKLHKSVKETKALYRRVNKADNIILNHSENKLKRITHYILEHSTIEPNTN